MVLIAIFRNRSFILLLKKFCTKYIHSFYVSNVPFMFLYSNLQESDIERKKDGVLIYLNFIS